MGRDQPPVLHAGRLLLDPRRAEARHPRVLRRLSRLPRLLPRASSSPQQRHDAPAPPDGTPGLRHCSGAGGAGRHGRAPAASPESSAAATATAAERPCRQDSLPPARREGGPSRHSKPSPASRPAQRARRRRRRGVAPGRRRAPQAGASPAEQARFCHDGVRRPTGHVSRELQEAQTRL